MDQTQFEKICDRVEQQHQRACVQHADGRIGEVVGCMQLADSFRVKVPPGSAAQPELWPRDDVVAEVTCPAPTHRRKLRHRAR